MAIITTDDAKAHLNITEDADDALISDKIDAAQAAVEQKLGYAIETKFPTTVPADLKEAVRALTAHLYENREGTIVGVGAAIMPLSVTDIIRSRRDWSWTDDAEE